MLLEPTSHFRRLLRPSFIFGPLIMLRGVAGTLFHNHPAAPALSGAVWLGDKFIQVDGKVTFLTGAGVTERPVYVTGRAQLKLASFIRVANRGLWYCVF